MTPTAFSVFTGVLVQDSALSVSGVDRVSTSDRPFTIVDGTPVLSGRALKGAAVAMARRFFDPLPRSVSETAGRRTALRESAWRFRVERPLDADRATLRNRSGVGIRHKTGARAQGVLYDREVIETGTRWSFKVMVDWRLAGAEAPEVEGILGYVLSEHWAHGRCWLGGDVARGFGWCHLEDLTSYRVSVEQEAGAASRTGGLPPPLQETPTVPPTKSWSFRTFDVCIRFGEYRPDDDTAWGVDTLSIGAHSAEAGRQQTGTGIWAVPPWIADAVPPSLPTDRVIVMGEGSPVIPGSSLRGAMRHAHSRAVRAAGEPVFDPHTVDGDVPPMTSAADCLEPSREAARCLSATPYRTRASRGQLPDSTCMPKTSSVRAPTGRPNATRCDCSAASSTPRSWLKEPAPKTPMKRPGKSGV